MDPVHDNPDCRRCDLGSEGSEEKHNLPVMDSPAGSAPCYLSGSDGKRLRVTQDVVKAFTYLMGERRSGSVTVTFRNGGIAGVKVEIVVK